jgi:serine/threonine protein phosphatase PrpC
VTEGRKTGGEANRRRATGTSNTETTRGVEPVVAVNRLTVEESRRTDQWIGGSGGRSSIASPPNNLGIFGRETFWRSAVIAQEQGELPEDTRAVDRSSRTSSSKVSMSEVSTGRSVPIDRQRIDRKAVEEVVGLRSLDRGPTGSQLRNQPVALTGDSLRAGPNNDALDSNHQITADTTDGLVSSIGNNSGESNRQQADDKLIEVAVNNSLRRGRDDHLARQKKRQIFARSTAADAGGKNYFRHWEGINRRAHSAFVKQNTEDLGIMDVRVCAHPESSQVEVYVTGVERRWFLDQVILEFAQVVARPAIAGLEPGWENPNEIASGERWRDAFLFGVEDVPCSQEVQSEWTITCRVKLVPIDVIGTRCSTALNYLRDNQSKDINLLLRQPEGRWYSAGVEGLEPTSEELGSIPDAAVRESNGNIIVGIKRKMESASNRCSITAVIGAGGSGKTRFGAALLGALTSGSGKGGKTLFCAPGNVAIDAIGAYGSHLKVLRFTSEHYQKRRSEREPGHEDGTEFSSIVRRLAVALPDSHYATLVNCETQLRGSRPGPKRERAKLRAEKKRAETECKGELIREADVVIGTCAMIGGAAPGHDLFNQIVIDESSQLSIPEFQVVCTLAKRNASVVLLGDHEQMGPHDFLGEVPELGVSFMEFVLAGLPIGSGDVRAAGGDNSRPQLDYLPQQFRQHPELSRWAREVIYDNQWSDSPTAPSEGLYGSRMREAFIHVDRSEHGECLTAFQLIRQLLRACVPEDIRVLCTWNSQRSKMDNLLAEDPRMSGVSCSTTAKCQGGEWQVVIILLGLRNQRESAEGGGWQYDSRPVNVSFGRAQVARYVIGDTLRAETFGSTSFIAGYVRYMRAKGNLIRTSELGLINLWKLAGVSRSVIRRSDRPNFELSNYLTNAGKPALSGSRPQAVARATAAEGETDAEPSSREGTDPAPRGIHDRSRLGLETQGDVSQLGAYSSSDEGSADPVGEFFSQNATTTIADWGYSQDIGIRPYQEDRISIADATGSGDPFLAVVYDGHGGDAVSTFSQDRFTAIARLALREGRQNDESVEIIYRSAVNRLDGEIAAQLGGSGNHLVQGSTLCAAAVSAIDITITNLGDSWAAVYCHGIRVFQTNEHSAWNERRRIRRCGGTLVGRNHQARIAGDLNIGRSVGDFRYKTSSQPTGYIVGNEADVHVVPRTGDMTLVLCTDGIDSPESIGSAEDANGLARRLVREGNGDNASAIVICLPAVENIRRPASWFDGHPTLGQVPKGSPGSGSSKVQAQPSEADFDTTDFCPGDGSSDAGSPRTEPRVDAIQPDDARRAAHELVGNSIAETGPSEPVSHQAVALSVTKAYCLSTSGTLGEMGEAVTAMDPTAELAERIEEGVQRRVKREVWNVLPDHAREAIRDAVRERLVETPEQSEVSDRWIEFERSIAVNGSRVLEAIRKWSDPSYVSGFPEGVPFQALFVDDLGYSIHNIFDGVLKKLLNLHTCESLGTRLSLRKVQFFVRELDALGFKYKDGSLIGSEKLIGKLAGWPKIPSQSELASTIGITGYFAVMYGMHYKNIMYTLRKALRVTARSYPTYILKEECVEALCDLHRLLCSVELRPIDRTSVLKGERRLFILIDASRKGCGYVVITIDARTEQAWKEATDTDIEIGRLVEQLEVHDLDSRPFPANARPMVSYQLEILGGVHYKRHGDRKYKYLPRTILYDYRNLGSPQVVRFHPATFQAFARRAEELEELHSSPGVRRGQLPGEQNDVADKESRKSPGGAFTDSLAKHLKTVLRRLYQPLNPEFEISTKDREDFVARHLGTEPEAEPAIGNEDPTTGVVSVTLGQIPEVDLLVGETNSDSHADGDPYAFEERVQELDEPNQPIRGWKWYGATDLQAARIEQLVSEAGGTVSNAFRREEFVDREWVFLRSRVLVRRDRSEGAGQRYFRIGRHRDDPGEALSNQVGVGEMSITEIDADEAVAGMSVPDLAMCNGLHVHTGVYREVSVLKASGSVIRVERIQLSGTTQSRTFLGLSTTNYFDFPPGVADEISFMSVSPHPAIWGIAISNPTALGIFGYSSGDEETGVANWTTGVVLANRKRRRIDIESNLKDSDGVGSGYSDDDITTETLTDLFGDDSIGPDAATIVSPEETSGTDTIIDPYYSPERAPGLPVEPVDGSDEPRWTPKTGNEVIENVHASLLDMYAEGIRSQALGGNCRSSRERVELTVTDARNIHEHAECIPAENIVRLVNRGRKYSISLLTAQHGCAACRICLQNLGKVTRSFYSSREPSPFFWEIDVTFPRIREVLERRGTPSLDTYYLHEEATSKGKSLSGETVAVRIITNQLGQTSAEIRSETTPFEQCCLFWKQAGKPTEVSVSDSEAIGGDTAGRLEALGIRVPVLPRKSPNSQPFVCIRQLIFKIEFARTVTTKSGFDRSIKERVRMAESRMNERAFHGIGSNYLNLMPHVSQECFNQLQKNAVIAEGVIQTMCDARVTGELMMRMRAGSTLRRPRDVKHTRVYFWDGQHNYRTGIHTGGEINGVHAISAKGHFLRVGWLHIAWQKCVTATSFECYREVLPTAANVAVTETHGNWMLVRLPHGVAHVETGKIDAGEIQKAMTTQEGLVIASWIGCTLIDNAIIGRVATGSGSGYMRVGVNTIRQVLQARGQSGTEYTGLPGKWNFRGAPQWKFGERFIYWESTVDDDKAGYVWIQTDLSEQLGTALILSGTNLLEDEPDTIPPSDRTTAAASVLTRSKQLSDVSMGWGESSTTEISNADFRMSDFVPDILGNALLASEFFCEYYQQRSSTIDLNLVRCQTAVSTEGVTFRWGQEITTLSRIQMLEVLDSGDVVARAKALFRRRREIRPTDDERFGVPLGHRIADLIEYWRTGYQQLGYLAKDVSSGGFGKLSGPKFNQSSAGFVGSAVVESTIDASKQRDPVRDDHYFQKHHLAKGSGDPKSKSRYEAMARWASFSVQLIPSGRTGYDHEFGTNTEDVTFECMADSMCQGGVPGSGNNEANREEALFPGDPSYRELQFTEHNICNQRLYEAAKAAGYQMTVADRSHGIGGVNGWSLDRVPTTFSARFGIMDADDGEIVVVELLVYFFPGWRSGGTDMGLGTADICRWQTTFLGPATCRLRFSSLRDVQGTLRSTEVSKVIVINIQAQCSRAGPYAGDLVKPSPRGLSVFLPFPAFSGVTLALTKKDRLRFRLKHVTSRTGLVYVTIPRSHRVHLEVEPKGSKDPDWPDRFAVIVRGVEGKEAIVNGVTADELELFDNRLDAAITAQCQPDRVLHGWDDVNGVSGIDPLRIQLFATTIRTTQLQLTKLIAQFGLEQYGPDLRCGDRRHYVSRGTIRIGVTRVASAVGTRDQVEFEVELNFRGGDQVGEDIRVARSILCSGGLDGNSSWGSVSESRYKITVREQVDECQLKKDFEKEDREFYRRGIGVERDSAEFKQQIAEQYSRSADPTALQRCAEQGDVSTGTMCQVMEWAVAIIALTHYNEHNAEGFDLPTFKTERFGCAALMNLTKPLPTRRPGPIRESPVQQQLTEFIFIRDIFNGMAIPAHEGNKLLKWASNGMRRDRGGTAAGRPVVSYVAINPAFKDFEIPINFLEDTTQFLRLPKTAAYNGDDIARAFPGFSVDEELGGWTAIRAGSMYLITLRAYLGLKPWPSIWNLHTYPSYNRLRVGPAAVAQFRSEILSAIEEDEKNGLVNPIRGLFSRKMDA